MIENQEPHPAPHGNVPALRLFPVSRTSLLYLLIVAAEPVCLQQEQNGITIPQVVIVDMATGTESVGTRLGSVHS